MLEISIKTIYDNYQFNEDLKTGWGFSCLVTINEKNILFDTGDDALALLSNMEKLDIESKNIDAVFLSHNHYDHTGGLTGFLEKNSNVDVYLPSFPLSFKEKVENYGAQVMENTGPKEIFPDVFTTGNMGESITEQSMIIKTNKGLIIITGCAHPGIVNIVKKTKEILNEKIYLVLGGFHLFNSSKPQIEEIINDFKELGVEKVSPCHCTGDEAIELFRAEYGENFIKNGAGKEIKI